MANKKKRKYTDGEQRIVGGRKCYVIPLTDKDNYLDYHYESINKVSLLGDMLIELKQMEELKEIMIKEAQIARDKFWYELNEDIQIDIDVTAQTIVDNPDGSISVAFSYSPDKDKSIDKKLRELVDGNLSGQKKKRSHDEVDKHPDHAHIEVNSKTGEKKLIPPKNMPKELKDIIDKIMGDEKGEDDDDN